MPQSVRPQTQSSTLRFVTAALLSACLLPTSALAQSDSAPAILQWFDGRYETQENRTADIFAAGYGAVWIPPVGQADSGGFSVGYDVYDRFDLGTPNRRTLYGTRAGLETVGQTWDKAGVDLHVDLVWNHNGFADKSNFGFEAAGGYPGFLLRNPDNNPTTDGDFHSPFASGDIEGRISGLIDIDHDQNFRFVRNPVPGFNNIPNAGTQDFNGRRANVPTEANREFYPDQQLGVVRTINDPATGEFNIPVYGYNTNNVLAGDPVEENATGLLMRNAQWLVEVVGVDGFRLDATKHIDPAALNFYDRAVYRSNPRLNLDGSVRHVYSYGETLDGNRGLLQSYIRKDINPNTPDVVGGNRDALDYPMYFALQGNLTNNGFQNDWNNVVSAGMDVFDDGFRNGSQGVLFASNHDVFGPDLSNVAHAFVLTQPGNAIVYLNGKEHGDNRDFPKDGRGDALGGAFGDTITKLVEIRNTHGRGFYQPRRVTKETLVYERQGSMLVMLSNRTDSFNENITVVADFPVGSRLVELTGNAAANGLPETLEVFADQFNNNTPSVNATVLANDGSDKGYLIYGLQNPQSTQGLQLTNVAQTLAGNSNASNNFENGTNRVNDVHIIRTDDFNIRLETDAVTLPGGFRDFDADGDNALFKVNEGMDFNSTPGVDFVTPGSVVYGFEQFTDTRDPGFNNPNGGLGTYEQTIDTTQLEEGYNFITVRAFRHRADGGPAIFSDFKQTIYVDRLKPISAATSFDPIVDGINENRKLIVESVDKTADNVHVLFDLPANMTEQQILSMISSSSQSNKLDRDLWEKDTFGLSHGNHVATIVTFEIGGTFNIQREAGLFTSTIFGRGLGDLDFDGNFGADDINIFEQALLSANTIFNPAGDLDGNGLINSIDLNLLGDELIAGGANGATLSAYNSLVSSIPTPSTAIMLLLGLGAATTVRGNKMRRRRA